MHANREMHMRFTELHVVTCPVRAVTHGQQQKQQVIVERREDLSALWVGHQSLMIIGILRLQSI